MELGDYMTATEFAEKINTPYPTVAAWLREGRIPGAELHEIGNMKLWLIPVDVLKDFVRPKKGRPTKAASAKQPAAKKSKKGAK
jgi:excisionase family DNA binding protein